MRSDIVDVNAQVKKTSCQSASYNLRLRHTVGIIDTGIGIISSLTRAAPLPHGQANHRFLDYRRKLHYLGATQKPHNLHTERYSVTRD